MKLVEAYRLLRVRDGKPCTLFHGYKGSRTLPLDTRLLAEEGFVTNPGKKSNGAVFLSGWHVLPAKHLCEDYLRRFKNKDDIVVCRVLVAAVRQKPRSEVSLARYMKITTEDWNDACQLS